MIDHPARKGVAEPREQHAAIHRRVLAKDGKVLTNTTFTSTYLSARTITQVGVPRSEPLDGPPPVVPSPDGAGVGN